MSVGDVAEFAAFFEVAVDSVEHTDYCMSAQAEDVFNLSAFKVIDDEISYKFLAHA